MNLSAEQLLSKVESQFSGDSSGHDLPHIQRVLHLARILQEHEGGDVRVIEFAAVLHDISDHKFNGGKLNEGGTVARTILMEEDLPADFIDRVSEIIDLVSFKGALTASEQLNLEAQIVQDADRLDALGAIGIARTFAYGGFKGQEMYNPELKPTLHQDFKSYANSKTTSVNHFYEKLLLLKDRLNTETAKRIAADRHSFMEEFLERFLSEWECKQMNL
jgi:uncharacterized protein